MAHKFHEFYTCFDAYKQERKADGQKSKATHSEVYAHLIETVLGWSELTSDQHNCARNHFLAENAWYNDKQPYYLVYPKLVEMFKRIKLDAIPASVVQRKVQELGSSVLLRFAIGSNHVRLDGGELRGILLTFAQRHDKPGENVISLHSWFGMLAGGTNLPLGSFTHIPVSRDEDLQASMDDLESFGNMAITETDAEMNMLDAMHRDKKMPSEIQVGEEWTDSHAEIVTRIAVGCLLLSDDLLTPDVLKRDEGKPITDTLINRAHRRGKKGWHLGREIEVVPHWRRPHLAWVRCGQGRADRRLVMRKGSVVHREKVKDLPTGYGGEE